MNEGRRADHAASELGPDGVWFTVTYASRDRVRLAHGPAGVDVADAELRLSPGGAAALGASLLSFAMELDHDVAAAAAFQVLTAP